MIVPSAEAITQVKRECVSGSHSDSAQRWKSLTMRYKYVCVCVCVCVCFLGKGRGGTPHMHGHKESYKDLNLKILTSEWDSNPRPHEY